MSALQLTQKNKMALFIGILCVGFIAVGIFTSQRLMQMVRQYEQSAKVSAGAKQLYATQADLLTLSAGKSSVSITDVSSVSDQLDQLTANIDQDAVFLNSIGLQSKASLLVTAATEFEQAMRPWLDIKSELGFSVDEGKLGTLKHLATTIEEKIAETGMVSINADFQVLVKAEQTYLLNPNENNLKLFNRAMAMFINSSKSYSMLDLYEEEIEMFKSTFVRVGELSQQLDALDARLSGAEQQAKEIIRGLSLQLTEMSAQFQLSAERDAKHTTWSLLIAFVVLAIITISLSVTMSLSMGRSLSQVKRVLDRFSGGDLSTRLPIGKNQKDEFNQLAMALNQSSEHLGKLVQAVQKNSQALSGDTTELNNGIDALVIAHGEVTRQTDVLAHGRSEPNYL